MALVSHRLEYYKLIIIFFLFLKRNIVTSLAPPGQPSLQFSQETPTEGKLVTIACTVQNGDPRPSVVWYRDNIEVDREYSTQGSALHNMYSFVVLREYHNSEFKCVTKNSQGEKFATKKFIDIYVKTSEPVISGPNNVPENIAYTWSCVTTRGHPKPTVKWMREGSYVPTATENEVNNDDGTVNITATYKYTPTKSNNGDVLTCLVSEEKTITGNGNLTSSITWNIYYNTESGPNTASIVLFALSTLLFVASVTAFIRIRYIKGRKLQNERAIQEDNPGIDKRNTYEDIGEHKRPSDNHYQGLATAAPDNTRNSDIRAIQGNNSGIDKRNTYEDIGEHKRPSDNHYQGLATAAPDNTRDDGIRNVYVDLGQRDLPNVYEKMKLHRKAKLYKNTSFVPDI